MIEEEEYEDLDQWNDEDASDLDLPDDESKFDIVVASRDWTVDTIVRQVEQGNIDLDPAFQRRNAWRDIRRSRLLESFILGFPVPQIVLAEHPRKKGSFIVIDGKQRLLTISGFYLPAYRNYWTQPRLTGLKVLKNLNRTKIETFLEDPEYGTERRRLANADIRTTVITGFRHEDVLYDIFYRINTGSVPLSSQELRQVLNRGPFSQYLLEITGKANPFWTVLGIEEPDARLRDVELLLRLLSWRTFSRLYRGNMKPFLDDTMTNLNRDWLAERKPIAVLVEDIFQGVKVAAEVFGENVGRKFKNGEFEPSLNRALFEVQAYYFSFPETRKSAVKHAGKVKTAFLKLSADSSFTKSIEATTKSIENYRIRFDKFRTMLEKALDIKLDPLRVGAG